MRRDHIPADADELDPLLRRFSEYDADAARCLEALIAADRRLDLCVGSIAGRIGVSEAARRTGWSTDRVQLASVSYMTARKAKR